MTTKRVDNVTGRVEVTNQHLNVCISKVRTSKTLRGHGVNYVITYARRFAYITPTQQILVRM